MTDEYKPVQILRRIQTYDPYYTACDSDYRAWCVTDGLVEGHGPTLKAASKDYEANAKAWARTTYYAKVEREKEEYRAKQEAAKAKRAATLAAKKAAAK